MNSRATDWKLARAIAGDIAPLPPVLARLDQAAGAVLAADLHAPAGLPAADTAAMDGFAVRGPGPWRSAAALWAGQVPAAALGAGEAAEIATGAAVPPGTDAVLRYEDARRSPAGEITGPLVPGQHIRRAGTDVSAGDLLITAGTRLTALMVGLAASVGHDEVRVHPRPRVAVTITGAEIHASGLPSAQVTRDAIGPAIAGLTSASGGRVTRIQYAGDDESALSRALAADDVDVHVVTGGSSVGPADLLHKVLAGAGAGLLVDGVRCRPGHPQLLAAAPGGRRVVGLPGNPLAAVAGILTLLTPLLASLSGAASPPETLIPRPAGTPRRPGHTLLLPVRYDERGGVRLLPRSSSASLRAVAHASHLLAAADDGGEALLLPLPAGIVS